MANHDDGNGLIELAVGGDRDAAAALLVPYLHGLETFLHRHRDRYLAQRESVVDLVQSTCREVLVDLPRFDAHGAGEAAFQGWLYRTMLRKLRDRERYYRRHKRDAGLEVAPGGDPGLDLACTTITPSGAAIGAEESQRVRQALEKLPEGHRRVIQMTYFEGRPAAEVAAKLGKNRVAVHSLLARALARLARVMGE